MSWAYGKLADGREIGYSVPDVCNAPGCQVKIDRGLAYVCGGMHEGGDWGCGKYFCEDHRNVGPVPVASTSSSATTASRGGRAGSSDRPSSRPSSSTPSW